MKLAWLERLPWINEDWPTDLDPDLNGVPPSNIAPLALPNTTNQVIFMSDGLPNTLIVGA